MTSPPPRPHPSIALSVEGLSKRFGTVQALDSVSFDVHVGEIHALLGQNGSGKSTLIRILAKYHSPDAGRVVLGGDDLSARDLSHARESGISFVHQDLGLVDSLSVLDNMRVGAYRSGSWSRISWEEERHHARSALDMFLLRHIDLDSLVSSLRDIERALLAIARAVQRLESGGNQGVLVLDEPTVYLPKNSIARLFEAMKLVTARGLSVIFVTHKLREVFEIADRVSVLRDGRLVGTLARAALSEDALVELILGHDAAMPVPPNEPSTRAGSMLRVRDLEGAGVRTLSLELAPGEIVGVTGLVGMGFEDVPGLIYGARRAIGGILEIDGQSISLSKMKPRRASALGISLVPANRLRDAIVPALTVADNVGLPVLGRSFRRLRLRNAVVKRQVDVLLREYGVKPPDGGIKMAALSGGNQQKCVIAKWVQTSPRLLILHEPTQGVDIHARLEIFRIIREVADRGTTILVASAEQDDLAALCHRVLILSDGAVTDTLCGAGLTANGILEASMRVPQPTATRTPEPWT